MTTVTLSNVGFGGTVTFEVPTKVLDKDTTLPYDDDCPLLMDDDDARALRVRLCEDQDPSNEDLTSRVMRLEYEHFHITRRVWTISVASIADPAVRKKYEGVPGFREMVEWMSKSLREMIMENNTRLFIAAVTTGRRRPVETEVLPLFRLAVWNGLVDVAKWFVRHQPALEVGEVVEQTPSELANRKVGDTFSYAGGIFNEYLILRKPMLVLAAENGQTDMCRWLLETGVSANSRTVVEASRFDGEQIDMRKCHWTALHYAADTGNVELVRLLLESGAEVDPKPEHVTGHAPVLNRDGLCLSPLMVACRGGHEEIVRMLVSAGANVNRSEQTTPLHSAVEGGHLAICRMLVEDQGVDMTDRKQHHEFGGRLGQGVINDMSPNLLKLAACAGALDVIIWLVDEREWDIHIDNNSLLNWAVKWGRVDVAKFLLDRGVTGDRAGLWLSLRRAVRRENCIPMLEFMRDVLDVPPTLTRDNRGTLLFYAIDGVPETTEWLLENGVDPNATNEAGKRVLDVIYARHHKTANLDRIAEILVRAGARPASMGVFRGLERTGLSMALGLANGLDWMSGGALTGFLKRMEIEG